MATKTETRTRILDTAERLVQTRGFNGFSYADVAAELDLTKPALHYHFAGKAQLGEALVTRYTTRFVGALNRIEVERRDAPGRLEAYAKLYGDVLRDRRMCLCGMLASEYLTLPEPMVATIVGFFDDNEAWLRNVLDDGRADGTLHFAGTARDAARTILSTLQGAMLVARPYGDVRRFDAAASQLLQGFALRPPR